MIMSAIKDIVDLCIQLRNERRETWLAPVVERIQTLALTFQSAQVSLEEKHAAALTENVALNRKIFQMEKGHAKAMAERDAQLAELRRPIDDGFDGIGGTVSSIDPRLPRL
jgi:hypothetical protein